MICSTASGASADDDDLVAPVRVVRERRREREPLREGRVERLEDVVGDARPDQLQQHRGRHRHAEPQDRLVGLFDRVAVLERLHQHARHPREDAVDDEGGGVADEYAALAQRLGHRAGRGERHVVGRVGSHQLDQRHQRDRIEEVHADEPLGMAEPRAHLRHRERRRVGGEDAVRRDDALDGREDVLLHRQLLEHRFEHEVAIVESVPARRARDECGVLGLGGRVAQRVECLVTRAASMSRITIGTSSRFR